MISCLLFVGSWHWWLSVGSWAARWSALTHELLILSVLLVGEYLLDFGFGFSALGFHFFSRGAGLLFGAWFAWLSGAHLLHDGFEVGGLRVGEGEFFYELLCRVTTLGRAPVAECVSGC